MTPMPTDVSGFLEVPELSTQVISTSTFSKIMSNSPPHKMDFISSINNCYSEPIL